MVKKSLTLIYLTLLLLANKSFANKPIIDINQDSTEIGALVHVSLCYKHPIKTDIAFPDSTHNFDLFEYVNHTYYPTLSDSTHSIDSVTYTLQSFETTDSIKLSIPVFILLSNDTIQLNSDTVYTIVKRTVQTLPDTIVFKKEIDLKTPLYIIPWSIWVILGLIILVLLIIVFFIFKQPIKRTIFLFRLKKKHAEFNKTFTVHYNKLKESSNTKDADQLLGVWKKYLDDIDKQSISSLTTNEIKKIYSTATLIDSLKQLDKFIYAGESLDLNKALDPLKSFAEDKYKEKIQNIEKILTNKDG